MARTSEVPPGGRKLVEVDGRSVGVFNVGGTFVAVLNVCPHELAPVCLGPVRGTTLPSPPARQINFPPSISGWPAKPHVGVVIP